MERVRLVLRSEAMAIVLGETKHAELKLALYHHSKPSGHGWMPAERYMLLRVAFCAVCGNPLYGRDRHDRPTAHYRCTECGYYVNLLDLEDKAVGSLMLVAGDEIIHRKVVHRSDQRMAERLDLIRQIEMMKEITEADTSAVVATLEAKLKEITDSLSPGTEAWKPTDVTVAQHWLTLTTPKEQNDFLRLAKIGLRLTKLTSSSVSLRLA